MAASTKHTSRQKAFSRKRAEGRNDRLYDLWSLAHFTTGVGFGWIMPPFIALALMVIWEPFEILVLSPIFARHHIDFGYETLKNSMSDIVVDIIGVAIGYYGLAQHYAPPFHLFFGHKGPWGL